MKKILLLVSGVVLALALTACKPDNTSTLTAITLSGIQDVEITVGDDFNALTGITAMGDDEVDYTAQITVDSETCEIGTDGTVDTSTAKTCTLEYTVVAEGKFVRGSMKLTIKPEVIVIEDAPLLMSWDFEDATDLEGWNIYVANGGSIDMSIDAGAMKLVTTSGGARYETRLDYMGVPLEQGYDYKVSFKMKSDIDGKKVHLNFGELLPADPYFTPFKAEGVDIITLTTDWVEYSYTFHMDLDNQNGGPLFEMGNMEGSMDIDATMWIDDLKIEGGSGSDTVGPVISGADDVIIDQGSTFDATDGVTAMDFVDGDVTSSIVVSGDTVDPNTAGTYTVTYTVSDNAGNETSVDRVVTVVGFVADVNNNTVTTSFDTDMTITGDETADWYTTILDSSLFNAQFSSGQLIMATTQDGDTAVGTNFWDHIVRYTKMKFIEGVEYKIVFDAMTDETGNDTNNIMFKVESGDFSSETTLMVPDTMTTFEYVFTWDGATTTEGSLLFFVGGRVQTITVENVEVYISADGANIVNAPVFSGVDNTTIAPGDVFDLLDGVTAVDLEDGDVTPVVSEVVGPDAQATFDSNVEGTWTITYSATDTDSNETTATRVITVASQVYDPTDLLPNGAFDSSSWYTWVDVWNYNGSGAAEAYLNAVNTDTDAEMQIDIVQPGGTDAWTVQMTQDVTLEAGQDYQVTFDAYADADRTINAVTGYSDGSNTWHEFGGISAQAITTTKTTYTYTLTATDPGEFQVQLKFEAGGDSNDVYIDNVKLEKWDGSAVVADTDVVANGDMSLGDNLEGWSFWSAEGITSSLTEQWGELVFKYDSAGSANWNNQINFTDIQFEYGATYKITFEAKGDAARDFAVNVYDGANNFLSDPLQLTTDFQTYEHVFTYNGGDLAKVEFQLGTVTANSDGTMFYLDNVTIEKLQKPQVLQNGNFDESGWTSFVDYWWWSGAASEVYFNMVDGEMQVDIVQPGGAEWAIQLIQDITLEVGQDYIVTFDAYADADRTINAVTGFQQSSDNTWQQFGGITGQAITTTKTTYTYTLTATDPGSDQVQLKFEGGGNTTNFYIDNVKLEKYDGTAAVADTDIVVNGTFDQLLTWGSWFGDGGSGVTTSSVQVLNGELVVNVAGLQDTFASYATQVYQEGLTIEKGVTYRIEFDAYADAARKMNVAIGEPLSADPWFTDFNAKQTVDLDTTSAHYVIEFTMSLDTNENGKLVFELGTIDGVAVDTMVYLSNVIIYQVY